MKLIITVLVQILLIINCISEKKQTATNIKEEASNFGVKDSIIIDFLVDQTIGKTLLFKGNVIDTIDGYYCFQEIGKDSVIYFPVHIMPKDSNHVGDSLSYLRLFTPTKKIDIGEKLPLFSNYCSSPIWSKGNLYYWGLNIDSVNKTDQKENIYAVRYSLANNTLDTVFLYQELNGNDDRDYYTIPKIFDDSVVFKGKMENKYILSKEFKLLKTIPNVKN